MSEMEQLGSLLRTMGTGPHGQNKLASVKPPQSFIRAELPALPAPICASSDECSMCKGKGYLRHNVPYGHPQFGKLVMCQCKLKQQVDEHFQGAHIPHHLQQCSFEQYARFPISAEQRKAAMQVQTFVLQRLAGHYSGSKCGLYLYGLWGLGKTGLAISALLQAIAAGKTGLYLSTAELFDTLYESIAASHRLMRGYGDEEDQREESAGSKVLRLVERVEWLVLDDVGVECGSRFAINRFYQIIEGRRSQPGRYTIFTSNRDMKGLEQHWRPEGPRGATFDDGIRIIERLGEYCVGIHLIGQNLRQR